MQGQAHQEVMFYKSQPWLKVRKEEEVLFRAEVGLRANAQGSSEHLLPLSPSCQPFREPSPQYPGLSILPIQRWQVES